MAGLDLKAGYVADFETLMDDFGKNSLPRDILIKNDQLTVIIGSDELNRNKGLRSFFINSKRYIGMPIVLLPSEGRNYLRCLFTGVAKQGKKPMSSPLYEEVKILRESPEVVVEAAGENLGDRLRLITRYELKPGKNYLCISTKITNVSGEEISFEAGDVLITTTGMFGFSQFAGPVRGFMVNLSPSSEQWFATYTHKKTSNPTSYIEHFPKGATMSMIDIWGAEAYARLNLKLAPEEDYIYERFLLAAPTSNVKQIYSLICREILHRKMPLGEIRGRVLDVYGRKALNMALTVKHGEEALLKTSFTHVKFRLKPPMVHRSGGFRFFLPPSLYSVVVEHQGATMTKNLKVLAGRTVKATFDQRPFAGYVTGKVSDEKDVPIVSRIDLIKGGRFFSSSFSNSRGVYTLRAPPGRYRIIVSRGFEYSYAASEIEIGTGEKTVFNARIRRILNYKKFGWSAGDQHLHTTHMDGFGNPREMVTAAEGTGLNWVFLTDYPSAALSLLGEKSSRVLALPAQEFSNKCGHFNALGVTRRIRNNLGLDAFLSKVHDERGIAIINHPYDMGYFWYLENFGGVPKEFDGVEVWNGGRDSSPNEEAMREWYSYLNQGKRLIAVASSDAHNVDNVGYPRTYVKVKGKPTLNRIIESEKNLRAFCTNGPLIRFTVNGKGPGEILTQVEGKVRVKIAVDSIFPVSGVRLIKNGEEILDVKLRNEYRDKISLDLKVEDSCWLIAQVYGVKPMKDSRLSGVLPFAFTNPIFIRVTRLLI